MSYRAKYRLICDAPKHLTTYNKDWNKSVEAKCKQDPLYEPRLTCVGCEYLNATRLK